MPWNVRRDGTVLEVRISAPVGDWEALFDAVQERLGNGLVDAIVPECLPNAPLIDNDFLERLRTALLVSGIELRKPALV
jgi:hypothetical protein